MFYNDVPKNFSHNSSMEILICYCLYKDKILFLRRKSGKFQELTWTAPGGKKEKNETPVQGICREVYEETRIELKENQLEDLNKFYIQIPNISYSIQIFKAHLNSFEKITLNLEEHDQYKWVTKEEALKLPLIAEGDQCLLTAFPELTKI